MPLDGWERRLVKCKRCGVELDPRCSRYWFLYLGNRGHDAGPASREVKVTLCGPCGRELRDDLELFLIGGDLDSFRNGVVRCGRSLAARSGEAPGSGSEA